MAKKNSTERNFQVLKRKTFLGELMKRRRIYNMICLIFLHFLGSQTGALGKFGL